MEKNFCEMIKDFKEQEFRDYFNGTHPEYKTLSEHEIHCEKCSQVVEDLVKKYMSEESEEAELKKRQEEFPWKGKKLEDAKERIFNKLMDTIYSPNLVTKVIIAFNRKKVSVPPRLPMAMEAAPLQAKSKILQAESKILEEGEVEEGFDYEVLEKDDKVFVRFSSKKQEMKEMKGIQMILKLGKSEKKFTLKDTGGEVGAEIEFTSEEWKSREPEDVFLLDFPKQS